MAERKALEARDRGIDLSAKTCTVKELLDRFVADRRSKGRALRTVARYDEIARHSIAPHVGTLVLVKLTPAHVSSWLALLREKGSVKGGPLAPKSVKHAFAMLGAALRWAVRHDLLTRNVCDAVDAPSAPRSQARALDEDEAARFFAVADSAIARASRKNGPKRPRHREYLHPPNGAREAHLVVRVATQANSTSTAAMSSREFMVVRPARGRRRMHSESCARAQR